MTEQFNPAQYNPQEFLGPLQEIKATMIRIYVDTHTPANNRKSRNLFTAKSIHTSGRYTVEILGSEEKYKFNPTDTIILDQAEDLVSNRFPEMNFMYRKTSKKDKLPDDPTEFFETLKNAPVWLRRQVNIDTKQIEAVKEKVASEQLASQINLSPLYLFGQLLSLSEIGLNIVGPEDYKKGINKLFGNQAEQRDLTEIIRLSVLRLIITYFHPKTVESLSQFLQATPKSIH